MATPLVFARDARRQLVLALPDTMQPRWLAKTWSATHGERDLTARVHSVKSAVELGAGSLEGWSYVRGDVRNGDVNVGRFTRDLKLHGSGRMEVHHSYLELEQHVQGSGFARAFNDRAFARYAASGVDDVTVAAALDVGGYAWARQGFEIDVSDVALGERELARARYVRNLVAEAEHGGLLTRADAQQLDPLLLGADGVIHPQTLTSVQDLAAIPELGRRTLLGNSWNGIREIQRERPWWHASAPGTGDVRAGVSYLATPGVVQQRIAAAAAHVDRDLPAPARTADVRDALARRFSNSAHVEPSTTKLGLTHDSFRLTSRTEIDLGDASITADVETDKRGRLNVRQAVRGRDDALRASLDDTWRNLGVATVAESGTRRSL